MHRLGFLAFAICLLAPGLPASAQWRSMGLSLRTVNRLQVHDGNLDACTNAGLYRIPLASVAVTAPGTSHRPMPGAPGMC